MALTLTTGPALEPVSLADAKAHLRVTHNEEDALISAYITAARQYAETFLHRQLISATWTLVLDAFPTEFVLPYPPLQSVTTIKYDDVDGIQRTITNTDDADYQVDTDSEPGRVKPAYNATGMWPSIRSQFGAVEVAYVAGYGDDEGDVPQSIRTAIKILMAHLYEQREMIATGTIVAALRFGTALPAAEALLWQRRIMSF